MVTAVLGGKTQRRPSNTGEAEQRIRDAVCNTMRLRWSGEPRIIHELALGNRRIDMLFVYPADLIGFEIKGPNDSVAGDRLPGQLDEYARYIPEVWLIAHEKHEHRQALARARYHANVAIYRREGEHLDIPKRLRERTYAKRDELVCSRLLELLWNEEAVAVAKRTGVAYEARPGIRFDVRRIKGMLARMLTGNEILREVCTELRSRPEGMVGVASGPPVGERIGRRS